MLESLHIGLNNKNLKHQHQVASIRIHEQFSNNIQSFKGERQSYVMSPMVFNDYCNLERYSKG